MQNVNLTLQKIFMSPKILITGANGQIGRVLTEALRQKFGRENVLATDITKIEDNEPFEFWTFSTHNVFMK